MLENGRIVKTKIFRTVNLKLEVLVRSADQLDTAWMSGVQTLGRYWVIFFTTRLRSEILLVPETAVWTWS